MRQFTKFLAAVSVAVLAAGSTRALAATPWATSVVNYSYDGDADPGNDAWQSNSQAALGIPSAMAGSGTAYAAVTSLFNGPWTGGEIVAIGHGGQLVVAFDRPIVNDASHLYGVDLIVFGHAAFWDQAWPQGEFGPTPSLLPDMSGYLHAGQIEVSADGVEWRVVPNVSANTMFPTLGFLDSGPYDTAAGGVPADFLKPVNPALQPADFAGLTYAQAVALYDGSGGGTGVDLASVGLNEANFVRITVPQGAAYESVEIDAFVVVPEPATLLLLVCGAAAIARGRRA